MATGAVIAIVIAYFFVTTNEWIVAVVLLGIPVVALILAQPFLGLLLFVVLLYFRPEETFSDIAGTHITLVVSVLTLIGAGLLLSLRRQPIVRSPLNGMILAFGIVVMISSFGRGKTADAFMDTSKLVILVFLLLNLVRSPGKYRALVSTLILATTYLAAYSIYLYYNGGAVHVNSDDINRSRDTGIFGDPNDLATTIAAGVALTLVSMKQYNRLTQCLLCAAVCSMFFATYLTDSRGGLLALVTAVMGFVIYSTKRKVLAVGAVAIAFVGLMLLSSSRMTNYDTDEESANQRFWYWSTGVQMLVSYPIQGVGYGEFEDNNGGRAAHSSFVNCFGELGLPGYFCWIGCLYYAYRSRSRASAAQSAKSESNRRDLFAAHLALGSFLVGAFWLSRTYVPVLYVLIALPIAQQVTASGLCDPFQLTSSERFRDMVRVAAICIASIFFIAVVAFRYR